MLPKGGGLPTICIGAAGPHDWPAVYGVALHEVLEVTLTSCGARFVPNPDMSQDSGSYRFFFDHALFSEVAADAGVFMSNMTPDLATAFRKFHKKKK